MRRTILGDTAPFHRLGLPPDNKVGEQPDPAVDVSDLGVDVLAEATLDEVLTVREERTREVRALIGGLAHGDLSRVCAPNPAPGGLPPSRQVSVQMALDVVIREEWLHHEFATRDLASLERRRRSHRALGFREPSGKLNLELCARLIRHGRDPGDDVARHQP